MKCPYCVSEISDDALACPNCTRDLYLFKPLLAKIEALEATVTGLEERLKGADPPQAAVAVEPEPELGPDELRLQGILFWTAPLLLLLIAHALITVVYDINTLYLRVVSLLIPLPFGLMLMRNGPRRVGLWLFAAFAMAMLAVLGMSTLTASIDHVAILPQERREWREFVEYAASIGFSFVTGMVLGRMLWQQRQMERRALLASELALKLAKLVATGQQSAEKIGSTVKKINDLRTTITLAATSATSIYMGLKGFMGGG